MKKIAIYTACIGGYDDVAQHLATNDKFDYFLFSDQPQGDKCGIWNVRQAPKIDTPSPILLARYIKSHPHELLPQYDAWIWVDGNIVFADNYIYNRFFEWYKNSSIIATCPHPATDDVYEHIYEMCCFGFEHDMICLHAMRYLFTNAYPEHNGLSETNILFRKNVPSITDFNEQWWWHIENLSRRDQFSFNYVLYHMNIQWESILPMDEPVCKSPHLHYCSHSKIAGKRKGVKMTLGEYLRHYVRLQHPAIYKPFVEQYKKMSKYENYELRLKFWGWVMFLLHALYLPYAYRFIRQRVMRQ